MIDKTYLVHYGVKGMKWRIQKDQDISAHYPNNIKNKHIYKRGKPVRGTSELWEIGKAVVEAMLGGDEGVF